MMPETGAPGAPRSEDELLARARALAGCSVGELAARLGQDVPARMLAAKGFAGQLIERALGASAGSLAEPDFQRIGVELKTIPVGPSARPLESTYVSTVPLTGHAGRFEDSAVARKLARVLWIPVQGARTLALRDRRIGMALLWSPSPVEYAVLRTDWEEHMERICLGHVECITARQGVALQVRPKAADARARRRAVGEDGAPIATLPRGFYLRARFSAEILARHYLLG